MPASTHLSGTGKSEPEGKKIIVVRSMDALHAIAPEPEQRDSTCANAFLSADPWGSRSRQNSTTLSEESLKAERLLKTMCERREVSREDVKKNSHFPNNYVRTTKYTLFTFLPLNLFEQFRKVANVYFLLNMVIALVPGVSPVFPLTAILPLAFVLSVAAIKDGWEDYWRHREDKRVNGTKVKVLRAGKHLAVRSDAVKVGDIVVLERDKEICCDCVVLSSPLPDGMCYIETSNLDGEGNLKPRLAPLLTRKIDEKELEPLPINVVCDLPNASLTKWEGVVEIAGSRSSLDLNNFLPRGCTLRNTPKVYAMALYTGVDTKVMLNLRLKSTKFSNFDHKLNVLVTALLILQQILIALLSVGYATSTGEGFYFATLYQHVSKSEKFGLCYLTHFVLLSYMMPISLFVSLELCKACQAKFMEYDVELRQGDKPMKAKTSTLNDELGQVRYLFTDKTGTLTQNKLQLQQCLIGKTLYQDPESIKRDLSSARTKCTVQSVSPGTPISQPQGEFDSDYDAEYAVEDFMQAIAFCHTVITTMGAVEDVKEPLRYEGQSTDEVALVEGARRSGVTLVNRTANSMSLKIHGKIKTVEILRVLHFDSIRQCMSVIIRDGDQIILYIKGADSKMIGIGDGSTTAQKRMINYTADTLGSMASQGLRTLVIGKKLLTENDYKHWSAIYDDASLAFSDREATVSEAYSMIEENITILGCTGVEDQLQAEVPETIQFFLRADVSIWMLTGDKRETAVNIACSCKLATPTDTVHHLEAIDEEHVRFQLESCTTSMELGARFAIVIDGPTLEVVFGSPKLKAQFQTIGFHASWAIACRVTPLQKSLIVALYQKKHIISMAIGDGANDVSMLQEAKVGVGIMGVEGSQAELASDYAIHEFRHLRRLVAIHGRFALIRNSLLVHFSFYKNFVLSMINIYFSVSNNWSGQTLFDSWALTFFNMFFTALPPLLAGIFEKDLPDALILENPSLLKHTSEVFTVRTVVMWSLNALLHSGLLYLLPFSAMSQDDIRSPHTSDIWCQGTIVMTGVICVVLCKLGLHTRLWTWVIAFGQALSIFAYIIFLIGYSSVCILLDQKYYYGMIAMILDPKFVLWILWFSLGMLSMDMACMFAKKQFRPSERDIILDQYAAARMVFRIPSSHSSPCTV